MTTRRDFARLLAAGALAGPLFATRAAIAAAPTPLGFRELYERETVLAPRPLALAGQRVAMTGFMAPPLKAEADFFVLTSVPLAVCPFCETEAQWPDDIVFVRMDDIVPPIPFNRAIAVSGILDLGFATDPATGFISLIRIIDADVRRV